ncbi:MAG: hypothetical protein G01um101433_414 [Parcubacteria group bacterium Gr01-1014_33]|nr:MAG: hypothetical protein G01um101433_414 [Parcubacteria group bacterium Gr01-1014_33]
MENRITFNPNILQGKPIIKGTRISVEFILELLASGMRPEVSGTRKDRTRILWNLRGAKDGLL